MMKFRQILLSLLLYAAFSAAAYSQNESLVFNSKTWDFGQMSDREGAVTHVYRFRNVSSAPVRVGSVSVSCGCIELEYPRNVISPGEEGDIIMTFFPSGTGGEVMRTADLYDGRGKLLASLSMTAYVERVDTDLEDVYHAVLTEGLAADRADVSFGYIWHCTSQKKIIRIANLSDRSMNLRAVCEEGSGMLGIDCPSVLPARSEADVVLEYRIPCDENLFGVARDHVIFFVDGKPARKTVNVTGIYMAQLPKDGDSPSMRTWPSVATLEKSLFGFGRSYSGVVNMENGGKAPLRILSVISDADVNLKAGTVIPPGGKLTVKASSYEENFTVEVFTNDPVRPYKELIFKH